MIEQYHKLYDELPPPIAERAKRNLARTRRELRVPVNLEHAIDRGFWWDGTPEGHSFWSRVYFEAATLTPKYPTVKGLPE